MTDEQKDPGPGPEPEHFAPGAIRPLTEAQMKQLTANLNPARVASRRQGGANLSYLETWDVRASLVRIFGFGGWSADLVEPVNVIHMDKAKRATPLTNGQDFNWVVTALATVRLTITQLGCTYTESAAASQTGPDIGEVTDFAVKTAESDALKRAAVNLGTQFGMSLYDNGSVIDVIKVVLAPGQRETLNAIKAAARTAAVPQGDTEPPAPGEDPRDDLPMALETPPTEPPRSRSTIAQGFDRAPR